MKTLLLAQWIAPVTAPLLREGGVVIESGRIVDVGPRPELFARHPDADIEDLRQSLIVPGLVNAHTHLELSDLARGAAPREGFAGWLGQMIARAASTQDAGQAGATAEATRHGISQCLRYGVTCVGDITTTPGITRRVLAASPLRAVSYGEVRAMGGRRTLLEERIAEATDPAHASPRLRIGLSPHAPYSVEVPGYARCLEVAHERRLPLATHLAESRHEEEFLRRQTGPLRQLWNSLPWDDHVPRFDGSPIAMAGEVGLLEYPAVLAHVNYCWDSELDLIAAGKASVVYCPRTHAWFEHRTHRFRDMLARGINVALGTDSCASSPDLNLLEEARLAHRLAAALDPQTLLRMITLNGARALGLDAQVGSIEPGKRADLAFFGVFTGDPLREIMEVPLLPTGVFIDGCSPAWHG